MLNSIKTEDSLSEREEIEQVRRLLFGEMQEANQKRMDVLESNMQALHATMKQEIAALGVANAAAQTHFMKNLGSALVALGEHISKMAESSGAGPDASNHD
jgi:hypothetical protein